MAIFALVDANNFYVSCERIFNPRLEGKAVVVLSNNDGCVVARSNESKLLGVKMGEPYFQMRDRFPHTPIIALSSNYTLYADISQRLMQILTEACPAIEIYSIDEAFLRLDGYEKWGLEKFATDLRLSVKQQIGLPISIGIASTKVLSKIANHIAKKHTTTGVYHLQNKNDTDAWLANFSVGDIWGVGPQWSKRLQTLGICTAKDLKNANPKRLQRSFSVLMARIVYELQGFNCLDLEAISPKKSIICSRAFGKLLTDKTLISQALSTYVARACEKLRSQHSLATRLSVFLRTDPFKEHHSQQHASLQAALPYPTADTLFITHIARQCLDKLYRHNYYYQKTGIMLLDFTTQQQQHLWRSTLQQREKLMKTLDDINQKFGSRSLFTAASGVNQEWHMRRENVTPGYTTNWDSLINVR